MLIIGQLLRPSQEQELHSQKKIRSCLVALSIIATVGSYAVNPEYTVRVATCGTIASAIANYFVKCKEEGRLG